MATYSRTGIGLTWLPNSTEGDPVEVAMDAELTLYTPDDVEVLRYKQEEQPDGSFTSDLSLGGSSFYVGGYVVDLDTDSGVIGVLQWQDSDGVARSTTVLRVDLVGQDSSDGLRDFSFVFPLEGDAFPDLQGPADWSAFEASITGFETAEGALGPNKNIVLEDILARVSDSNLIVGGTNGDSLHGTSGNDEIRPMDDINLEGDYIQPGTGNDTVVLSANESGYVMLSHTVLDDAIAVYLDGTQNTGRVEKASGGVTTLVDPNTPDSLRIFGTAFDDVFNVTVDDDGWVSLRGNGGTDEFVLGDSEGTVRLDLAWAGSAGVVVDLAQGRVLDDGTGTQNIISGTGHVGELRSTMGDDVVTGSAADESFILRGGDDMLKAGEGEDTLRYDNAGAEWVEANLAAGTATGRWNGQEFSHQVSEVEHLHGTDKGDDKLIGTGGDNLLDGRGGQDTLIGGQGNDTLIGGTGPKDLRDVIYAGEGNDFASGGYGNDELRGDAGNDTLEGGYGVDTVIGGTGADVLTGSAWSDLLFGGAGEDFLNGGFGNDRLNGGSEADRFFHIGVEGHGSDWIQDYDAGEGDVLVFGQAGLTEDDFQINYATTEGAGDADIAEAFVINIHTDQILWALVDGAEQDQILLRIAGVDYDLMA